MLGHLKSSLDFRIILISGSTTMAIQAHIEAEQKDAERQQSAEQLRGYAATVLDRLDQKGFPEIEPF